MLLWIYGSWKCRDTVDKCVTGLYETNCPFHKCQPLWPGFRFSLPCFHHCAVIGAFRANPHYFIFPKLLFTIINGAVIYIIDVKALLLCPHSQTVIILFLFLAFLLQIKAITVILAQLRWRNRSIPFSSSFLKLRYTCWLLLAAVQWI